MTLYKAMVASLAEKGIDVYSSTCLWVCEACPGQLWIHSETDDGKLDSHIVVESKFIDKLRA